VSFTKYEKRRMLTIAESDWDSNKEYHIDIWTGSNTVNGGDNQVNCENNLPGGPQTILQGPANNLPVDSMFDRLHYTYPGTVEPC